jgi:NhaA family Na+:H+ antiporter
VILSKTFSRFFEAEKSGGLVLVGCTVISLTIANSAAGLGLPWIGEGVRP